MQVEIVTDESRFLALAPVWNPLLQASRADVVFLTFEWLSTWWRHFGRGNQLFIVVVRDGERFIAIAPLMIRSLDGFRQLTVMGGHTTEYKDFIIRDGEPLGSTTEVILEAVLREKCWDFFKVAGFREDSSSLDSLKTILSRRRPLKAMWQENDISPYVAIDQPWEQYWGSLKGSVRNDPTRRMKMLYREVGTATYDKPKDPADVDRYFDELIKLHLIRRKEVTRTYSVFESPLMIDFYKDLARQLFARHWLSLPVLLVNGEVGAVHFGFEYSQKYFYYMPTFSHKFTKYSPGKSLLLYMLNDTFTRGLKEFDFLLGNEPYKFDFNPKVRKLYSVTFFRNNVRGRASQLWFSHLRPQIETVVNNKSFEQVKWWYRRRTRSRRQ